jgi:cytochrome oxidase Cu insertion factor (SCO1/SenC/PrrC family)
MPALGRCAPGMRAVQVMDNSLFDDNPRYSDKPIADATSPAYTGNLTTLPVQTVLVTVNSPATLERVRTYLAVHAPPRAGGNPGDSPTPPRTFGETLQIRTARAATFEKILYAAVALTLIVAGCSLAVTVGGGLVDRKRPFTLLRVSGTQVGVLSRVVLLEAAVPLLMGLSPIPVRSAPGFTLTDQNGRTLSLSSLRGKVAVLEFMDPHCTDICPIVSQEYVDAYRDLGPLAGKVVFAAVTVNQYHAAVSDMVAYSREQRLITILDWHFFTGPVPDLRKVWNGYQVTVQAPNPNADIVHTSAVYFIDPARRERFIAAPMADHTSSGASYLPAGQITAWGQGIVQVARALTG